MLFLNAFVMENGFSEYVQQACI